MVEHSTIFVPDVSYQDTLIVQSVYSCGIYYVSSVRYAYVL